MQTYFATNQNVKRCWYLVDATDQILGRLATQISKYLSGKHKAEYTPHVDVGDYLIIVNAEKIKVTGNKRKDKVYYSHSGYPGGLKEIKFSALLAKHPIRIIELAVKRMLPKKSLGRCMFRKLKVYKGPVHPHVAQEPIKIDFLKKGKSYE